MASANRFGKKILIVDTPGLFDTEDTNENIQNEIIKCMTVTSPGPHAFVLVISVSRFTKEEDQSVKHFVRAFGKDIFKYFIVLFTRKDDLDHDKILLVEHIKNSPPALINFIEKCGGRVIAFDNRLKGRDRDKQVIDLLSEIENNVKENAGECYKNEMYIKAEKEIKKIEADKRKKAKEKRDKKMQLIKDEFATKLEKALAEERTKNKGDFEKWKTEYVKNQDQERSEKEQQAEKEYEQESASARDDIRKEVVEEKSFLSYLWTGLKFVLPGVFTTYF